MSKRYLGPLLAAGLLMGTGFPSYPQENVDYPLDVRNLFFKGPPPSGLEDLVQYLGVRHGGFLVGWISEKCLYMATEERDTRLFISALLCFNSGQYKITETELDNGQKNIGIEFEFRPFSEYTKEMFEKVCNEIDNNPINGNSDGILTPWEGEAALQLIQKKIGLLNSIDLYKRRE